jgi:hypothetical protein
LTSIPLPRLLLLAFATVSRLTEAVPVFMLAE